MIRRALWFVFLMFLVALVPCCSSSGGSSGDEAGEDTSTEGEEPGEETGEGPGEETGEEETGEEPGEETGEEETGEEPGEETGEEETGEEETGEEETGEEETGEETGEEETGEETGAEDTGEGPELGCVSDDECTDEDICCTFIGPPMCLPASDCFEGMETSSQCTDSSECPSDEECCDPVGLGGLHCVIPEQCVESGGSGEETGEETGEEVSEATQQCLAICAAKDAQGWCINDDELVAECDGYCQNWYEGWTQATRYAFADCLENEPFCFQNITTCTSNKIYPNGAPSQMLFSGVGFDASEGLTIRVAVNNFGVPEYLIQEAVLTAGAFAMDYSFTANPNSLDPFGALVMFYIDVDGSGTCDASVDVTGTEHALFQGDLESVVFSFEVDGTQPSSAPHVCDYM